MSKGASVNSQAIKETVRAFILTEFLSGVRPEELGDSIPLITGGILDSLATVKLVAELEDHYGIGIEPHEVSVEHFNTVDQIVSLVTSKL